MEGLALSAALLLGWMSPSVSDGSGPLVAGRPGLGLAVETRALPSTALGAFVVNGSKTDELRVAGVSFEQTNRYTIYGIQAAWLQSDLLGGELGLGGRLGAASVSSSLIGSDASSDTNLAVGPRMAWEYSLGTKLSVGAETSFAWVSTAPSATWIFTNLAVARIRL